MARISKFGDQSTELRLVKLFRWNGIKGWRRHLKLPGRPDFTFRRERVVVFADGCFWHSCPQCNWVPTSNTDYWEAKFARNRANDRDANRALRRAGWKVIRVWEHSLKQPERVIRQVGAALGKARRHAPRG
jgi:DNA mismatch endonuclease (patch repair protein)